MLNNLQVRRHELISLVLRRVRHIVNGSNRVSYVKKTSKLEGMTVLIEPVIENIVHVAIVEIFSDVSKKE